VTPRRDAEHYPLSCVYSPTWTIGPARRGSMMLTSALWVGGEICLGVSLTMFVGAMIAIFGDRIRMGSHRQSGHVAAPPSLPNTGAFRLPTLDPPQLGHSRIGERARLVRAESAPAPRLSPAMADNFSRKGLARADIGRKAA
jgi:hypothetical protein